MTDYKSPLHQMVMTTRTDLWNDSCSVEELTYALGHGAVGATTNPTIASNVLKKEMPVWRDRILQVTRQNPTWNEEQIAWKIYEEMAVKGTELLRPAYERQRHLKGRLSIQTNPTFYRNGEAILQQALHFNQLAPNIQVKIPATRAGVWAIEEATAQGVNINATVSFTVAQCLAVAEAVERGLRRRESAGQSTSEMSPVCTLMMGRVDDWLFAVAKRDGISVTPGAIEWSGVAAIKRAYTLFKERGYRSRLLGAAYRHHLHWSELIGGDLILSIPYEWQKLYNASDIEVEERIQDPVPEAVMKTLLGKFPDFHKAYDEDGLALDEFDTYGATVRTLRAFIASWYDLLGMIREVMLPNPDVK